MPTTPLTPAPLLPQLIGLRLYALFTYPFACVPFLYFYFVDAGVSDAAYGTLISIYYLTMVVAEVPTGLLADRVGRRAALFLGPLLLAAGFWMMVGKPDYTGFVIAEILLGLGHSILSGPPSAILFEHLAAHRMQDAYRRHESICNTYRLVGTGGSFLLGGVVVAATGTIESAIVLSGALCCFASLAAWRLQEPRPQRTRIDSETEPDASEREAVRAKRPTSTLRAAVRDLRSGAVAWMLGYYVVLFFLLRFPFHTYQPYLRAAGQEDPLVLGGLFFALNAVAAPFSRATPWIAARLGTGMLLLAMPVVLALSMWWMGGTVDARGIALFFLHQVPFGMHMAVISDFVHHRIGDHARATVLSLLSFGGRIVFAIGFPLVLLQDDIGHAYEIVGAAGLAATLLAILLGRRHLRPAAARAS